MSIDIAGKAADIVDDNNNILAAVFANKGQHVFHAGPCCNTPGHIIGEDFRNLITPKVRILRTACNLRAEARTFGFLFR
ncbi:MAG: hypothetical protein AAFW83_01530 [Pseudomonadota bacterium]